MSLTLRKRIGALEAQPRAQGARDVWPELLRHMSDIDLARMHELTERYQGIPDGDMPPDVLTELKDITRKTVNAFKAADL